MKFFKLICCVFLSLNTYSQQWEQLEKIIAQDRISGATFGNSVSIDGHFAVVGAPKDNSDSLSQNPMFETGAVYIYQLQNGNWEFFQKIIASDRANYDYFGWSVSIYGDELAVGSYFNSSDSLSLNPVNSAGAVYLFQFNGINWVETQKVVASNRQANNYFGYAIDLHDKNLIVGSYADNLNESEISNMNNAGSASIFQKNSMGIWQEVQKICASDRAANDNFGHTVAITNKYAVIGSPKEAEDASGSNSIVGAGSAYIFKENSGTWDEIKKIVANDRKFDANFGSSVYTDDNEIAIGAFKESEDSLSLNPISGSGAVYFFTNSNDTWPQSQKIVASDRNDGGYFGKSLAIDQNYLLVGAYTENYDGNGQDSLNSAGACYLYEKISGNWEELNKFVANDRSAYSNFGNAVAIDSNYMLIGSFHDATDTTGNNPMNFAGSAYFFGPSCDVDTSVTINSNTLTANMSGVTYRWLDCTNSDSFISGETNQNFTPSSSGSYAVEITNGNCVDTSACKLIEVLGVQSKNLAQFVIYPNPSKDYFYIQSDAGFKNAQFEICNILGKTIIQKKIINGNQVKLDISDKKPGIYFIYVNNSLAAKITKL